MIEKTHQLLCSGKFATISPINEAENEVLKNDSDKNLNKAVIKLKKILFTVIILSCLNSLLISIGNKRNYYY